MDRRQLTKGLLREMCAQLHRNEHCVCESTWETLNWLNHSTHELEECSCINCILSRSWLGTEGNPGCFSLLPSGPHELSKDDDLNTYLNDQSVALAWLYSLVQAASRVLAFSS